MKIAISGLNGLVGKAANEYFKKLGHQVFPIIRSNDQNYFIDIQQFDGFDVIIHLAGASIADKRWTPAYKQEILDSRVNGTKAISQAIAQFKNKPKVFLCASAIGYYGHASSEVEFTETDKPGKDFLANVCKEWEMATSAAVRADIRVVQMRFGVILSKKGGALAKMWIPFILGIGGKLGTGNQMMSWISLDEIPAIMNFIIENEKISGPVNVVSPNPVNNLEFTKILGEVILRPTILPVPESGARFLFGEMADSLLLNGSKVMPQKLQYHKYPFIYPDLKEALTRIAH